MTTIPGKVDTPVRFYDELAEVYDSRYYNPTALSENETVRHLFSLIAPPQPRLLDIGCGTGLALEIGLTPVENFIGVAPSRGMLSKLQEKFPTAHTDLPTFEEWFDHGGQDSDTGAWILSTSFRREISVCTGASYPAPGPHGGADQ